MNTWQLESGFKCFPFGSDSRHTIVSGTGDAAQVPDKLEEWKAGKAFRIDYWEDPTIRNYRDLHGQTPAIRDGLYAHGISAVMGAYHVYGCAAYKQTFGSFRYHALAESNGLITYPGLRVTDLYTEDAIGRKRSIMAGIIILDSHYHSWLGKVIDTRIGTLLTQVGMPTFKVGSRLTSDQAITLATGSYLGFGKDSNNATGTTRAIQVKNNRTWTYLASTSSRQSPNTITAPVESAKPKGCI
jgi:hypothetical protein